MMVGFSNVESWTFLPALPESFGASDGFACETETLDTRALLFSLSGDTDCTDLFSDVTNGGGSVLAETQPAASTSKRHRQLAPPPPPPLPKAGRVAKRKSRGWKRPATATFVAADAASFRRLVQQVTGSRFEGQPTSVEAVPEPELRPAGRQVAVEGCCLPTLDTSAMWLERAGGTAAPSTGSRTPSGTVLVGSGFGMDPPFLSFPTLESWNL